MPNSVAPPIVVISFQKHLVGMHAHTGQRVWTFELGLKSAIGRLHVEHAHVFFITKQKMFCLEYLTGSELWTIDLPHQFARDPRVLFHAGCVILQNVGEAACFNLQDGSLRWHDSFKGFGVYEGAMAAPGCSVQIDRVT